MFWSEGGEQVYVELEMQSMLDITETEVRKAHGGTYLFPLCAMQMKHAACYSTTHC